MGAFRDSSHNRALIDANPKLRPAVQSVPLPPTSSGPTGPVQHRRELEARSHFGVQISHGNPDDRLRDHDP